MATGSSNEQLWLEMQERLNRIRRQRESLAAARNSLAQQKYHRPLRRTPSPLYLPRITGGHEGTSNSTPDLRRGQFGVIPPVARIPDARVRHHREYGNPKLAYINTKPAEYSSDDPRKRDMERRRSQDAIDYEARGQHQRSLTYPSRFPHEYDPSMLDIAQYIISNHSFANDFVERFILECLEDEIIPDLLITVLSTSENSLQYYPDTAIKEYPTDEVAWAIATDLLQEALVENTRGVVSTAIDELVTQHLSTTHAQHFFHVILEDFEQEALPSLVKESILEVEIDESLDMVVNEEVKKMSEEVAIETIQHCDNSLMEQEMKEVYEHARGKLLASAFLDQLLFQSLRSSHLWTEQEKADKLIDCMMLDILLHQYLEVWNYHKKTEECQPIRQLHENMFIDMAMDELINEIKLHLDEDMADLDEYETGLDLEPTIML